MATASDPRGPVAFICNNPEGVKWDMGLPHLVIKMSFHFHFPAAELAILYLWQSSHMACITCSLEAPSRDAGHVRAPPYNLNKLKNDLSIFSRATSFAPGFFFFPLSLSHIFKLKLAPAKYKWD